MKTSLKAIVERMVAMVMLTIMLLSFITPGYAAQETWNNGQKVNYVPSSGEQTYKGSAWTNKLIELYQAIFYQNPTLTVSIWDFSVVQLRTIQASLERRGLSKLSAENETLNFKNIDTLTPEAQEEAKILKSLGILTGDSNGYMKLTDPIKKCEAAKVLHIINNKFLKIPSLTSYKPFPDTKGHWAEKSISVAYQTNLLVGASSIAYMPNANITLEQTLKILENEIGYFGILRVDVAKAMSQTFKVTLNTDASNSIISPTSYVKYEEKMKAYGFDKLYDNGSAKSSESVTWLEVIKLVMGVYYNSNDLNNVFDIQVGKETLNDILVNHVDYSKITKEVMDDTNCNDKIKYIDAIEYFENCKINLMHYKPSEDGALFLTDMDKYSLEQQVAIKDMVANKIIYPLADKLNGDEYVLKGQLNEIIVNFAEKYNTLFPGTSGVNTDPDKMPSNAYLYPYILSSIDNSLYEKPFFTEFSVVYKKSPKEVYDLEKKYYYQFQERCQQYFDTILNIDYRTITREDLKQNLSMYMVIPPSDYALDTYIAHVKKNQIIIKGSSTVQLPIVYKDDSTYRVRVRLQFEVDAKTKECLLYSDMLELSNITTYINKKYDIYVDYYMLDAYKTDNLHMDERKLSNAIIDRDKSGIILNPKH